MENNAPECIGLIPAAGVAKRIFPLPCSKEIFPIGFGDIRGVGSRPKTAAHYLMEQMKLAGANRLYLVLSKGKWDIPAYFSDGAMAEMAIAYLVTTLPYGVPFTVDSAFPFLGDKCVLFGFPDIILQEENVYSRLLDQMRTSRADIVLGLFPAVNPQKMDMVSLDTHGAVDRIDIKPAHTDLYWTWLIAAWNARFTRYMHDYVGRELKRIAETIEDGLGNYHERFMGDVIQDAIDSGLIVDKVEFPEGRYIDIGTPKDMQTAIQVYSEGVAFK